MRPLRRVGPFWDRLAIETQLRQLLICRLNHKKPFDLRRRLNVIIGRLERLP